MKITMLTGHLAKERNPLIYELAVELSKHGASVTVISGYPSRRISEQTRLYYLSKPYEQINPNLRVIRVGSKKGEGGGLFIRMLKYILLTLSIYKKAKEIDTDVYYIYSTPPFLGVAGSFLALKKPTVYNAQDIFPDTLIALKKLSESNLLVRTLRKMEKFIYLKNSHVITISQDIKKTLVDHGCPKGKISVIHNWVDTDKIQPISRKDNSIFDRFKLDKSDFYVLYAGNIGLLQNLSVMIEAAEILENKGYNIKFVIVGEGSWKAEMKEMLEMKKLRNVFLFPLQSQELVSEVYNIGDIDVVSISKGVTKTALPSKTWNIMSAGKPIIAMVDYGSEIANIINEKNIGLIVKDNEAESFAEAVIYCYENADTLYLMGNNAREYVVSHNNRSDITKKYYDVIVDQYNKYVKEKIRNV